MNRRGFLQTVAFTLVAAYSPISLPRVKPPPWLISDETRAMWTPGIWAKVEDFPIDDFTTGARSIVITRVDQESRTITFETKE